MRTQEQLTLLTNLIGAENLQSTSPTYADQVFDDYYKLELAGVTFELFHRGPAHTPGDTYIWLPGAESPV